MKQIPAERVDNRIFMSNSLWADVDGNDFKRCLGELLKKKAYYRQNCLKTRDTIIKKFSQESVQNFYNAFLDELGWMNI